MSQHIFNSNICRILFATCLSALCLIALSTQAATITVMNTNNSAAGSLRQALTDAVDGDTINFDSSLNGQTITLTSGELLVDKNVIISGPGADMLAVDSNYSSRVFHIGSGKTVTISGLTITNGNGNFDVGAGGGIYKDHATLTVNNCTVSGNVACLGGGIFNGSQFGGSATLTINNSTISGNSASSGGGIYNNSEFNTTNTHSGNTILKAGASGENIVNSSGAVASDGYNLSSDNAGGLLTITGDQINADPLLGPLQDNGGPTFTHELLSGSPAIDAGDPNFTPPPDYDQRGTDFPRVFNGRVDIGAFEVQTVTPAYAGQVQPPINADGTSAFSSRRAVVPVKFNLTLGGVAACNLPPATIAVTRTAGGVIGEVNESVYSANADSGSNFRIDSCQYVYNLNSRALGVGTYRVDILINGQVVGSAVFGLKLHLGQCLPFWHLHKCVSLG